MGGREGGWRGGGGERQWSDGGLPIFNVSMAGVVDRVMREGEKEGHLG